MATDEYKQSSRAMLQWSAYVPLKFFIFPIYCDYDRLVIN